MLQVYAGVYAPIPTYVYSNLMTTVLKPTPGKCLLPNAFIAMFYEDVCYL